MENIRILRSILAMFFISLFFQFCQNDQKGVNKTVIDKSTGKVQIDTLSQFSTEKSKVTVCKPNTFNCQFDWDFIKSCAQAANREINLDDKMNISAYEANIIMDQNSKDSSTSIFYIIETDTLHSQLLNFIKSKIKSNKKLSGIAPSEAPIVYTFTIINGKLILFTQNGLSFNAAQLSFLVEALKKKIN